MKVLVTGSAGFCGMHATARLLDRGVEVVGIDNLNAYYDPQLKKARLQTLSGTAGFQFMPLDICDSEQMKTLFASHKFDRVLHLAAQPGVRYSLTHPEAYIQSNLVGFANILECCRRNDIEHLVYASSSSVYGANTKIPFAETDAADHPVSLYAATKKANELLAHSYSHLYGLPTTGLRFFTVYGPWGRPDMSPWLFTSAILEGRPIKVFNHGRMLRDFTYVEDIAEATLRLLDRPPTRNPDYDHMNPAPDTSDAPFRIYNVGNQNPIPLMNFISTLEQAIGREAIKEYLPMQPGDLEVTRADVTALKRDTGFEPATPIGEGIGHWVEWYKTYHGIK